MRAVSNQKRDAAWHRLRGFSKSDAREHFAEVAALLAGRRWPEVRVVAAEAMGEAGTGVPELRTALVRERNEVVLATVCEALMLLHDTHSVRALKRLARTHPSALVRKHAIWSVSELEGKRAIRFLDSLQRRERSIRVRAALKCTLVKNGVRSELKPLLAMLRSRDYIVRTAIANFFADNFMPRQRALVTAELSAALVREETRAAQDALERALHSSTKKTG